MYLDVTLCYFMGITIVINEMIAIYDTYLGKVYITNFENYLRLLYILGHHYQVDHQKQQRKLIS